MCPTRRSHCEQNSEKVHHVWFCSAKAKRLQIFGHLWFSTFMQSCFVCDGDWGGGFIGGQISIYLCIGLKDWAN